MADAVVSYAIQKINDAIINEALFMGSVEQQAEDLKEELTMMESFLQDADDKARGGNKLVENWVKCVRKAAHDAEDLIESFAIQGSEPEMGRGIFSNLMSVFNLMIGRHNSGLEIEELKQRIINIKANAAEYGLRSLPNDCRERRAVDEAIARRRAIALHTPDSSHVVLMEAEKKAILHLLDPEREKRRSVVSIVGMGGLGKTTLAKKVFKDLCIPCRFDCAVWIDVSQDYQDVKLLKDLLCKISAERKKEFETMEKTSLERCLYESLQGKTYLIVMDDVWDGEVWRIFGDHLPDEDNGSKVLITTRKREVADAADQDPATRAYKLRFLNPKESWELFLSKAIPRVEERSACAGRLKDLGEEMAAKCGGLPLALVVMGSLLSQKGRSTEEWERVSHVWRDNDKEGSVVTRILALSYADLPYDLKCCFLYLSAFPEDYLIESDRLIGLWIAEGFIAERDGLTLEETAEFQLEKLVERSLVHVVERDDLLGVISCRVHDLIRELCISEAKQIDFMSVCQRRSPLPAESLRRLSIITEPEETISRLESAPHLRALLGFNFTNYDFMRLSIWRLKLIRVIDLQGAYNLKELPVEIGGLVNLRYLGLEGSGIEWLPETIKNLSHLQFLNVLHTEIKEMTSVVWEIETLRQVFLPYRALAPNRVQCRWRSLQVLRWASHRFPDWMDDTLHMVKDIKTLEIWAINASHHEVLSLNLPQFSRLKILILEGRSIPWTAFTLSGLPQLRTLFLSGPISRGPVNSPFPEEVRPNDISWSPRGLPYLLCGLIKSTFSKKARCQNIPGSFRGLSCLELNYRWPASLTYLELDRSDLPRDPLPSLGQLSELRFLKLKEDVYSWGEEMKFRGDEFKQLQELELTSIAELERMTVEDGAMPCLQKVKIYKCPRLKTIPPRLEDIAEWKDQTTVKA